MKYPGRRLCNRCYKHLASTSALPPYNRKGKRIGRERPLKPVDSYSTPYGNSTDLICPRCEARPVYVRNIQGRLVPADCCISCRRAEQALASYWRLPDVNLPLAQYNENMRVRFIPISNNTHYAEWSST